MPKNKKKFTGKTFSINGSQGGNSKGSSKSTVRNLAEDLKELLNSLSKDLKEGDFNYYASKLVDAGIYNRDLLSSSSDSVLKRAGLSNIEERRKLLITAARIRVNPSYSTTRMGRLSSGVEVSESTSGKGTSGVTRMGMGTSGVESSGGFLIRRPSTKRKPSCRFCGSEFNFGHSGKKGVECGVCSSRVDPYETVYRCESCHQTCCDECRWGMPRPNSESEPDSVPVVLPGAKGPSEPKASPVPEASSVPPVPPPVPPPELWKLKSLKPESSLAKIPNKSGIECAWDFSLAQLVEILREEGKARIDPGLLRQFKQLWESGNEYMIDKLIEHARMNVACEFSKSHGWPMLVVYQAILYAVYLASQIPVEEGGGPKGVEQVKKAAHYLEYNHMKCGDRRVGEVAPNAKVSLIATSMEDSPEETSMYELLQQEGKAKKTHIFVAGSGS